MKAYTITLYREYIHKGRIIKSDYVMENVVGNNTLRDIPNAMLVVYEDDTREVVMLDKYDGYKLSREFFEVQQERVRQESQGQANIQPLKN
jgi:hypothetical protein